MTKGQEKRRDSYLKHLKKCGFRSWKQANQRRVNLCDKYVDETITLEESKELTQLQLLLEKYVAYKTNDSLGRSIRKAQRLNKRLTALEERLRKG